MIGLAGSAAMAAPGRMKGIVTDAAGNPLEGVTITIRSAEFNYEKVTTTKKNGSFSLAVTEGSHP
ncbi:MAG: carboxypeptidase-like regulatory domain-containing protein, partial [Acidobacteriota bacterium]|nr:carboxypeptidase-like regulatory domain-containing protein [Acidobacteriota bacterium]